MNKTEAVLELLRDIRRERGSRASYKRCCKALAALNTSADAIAVERGRVKAYFDKRPKFCVSFCPLYRELSDTCPVVDGDMEPARCPDSANLKEHHDTQS